MFNLWKYTRTSYCFPLSKTIFYSIYSGVYCVKEPADNNNNKNVTNKQALNLGSKDNIQFHQILYWPLSILVNCHFRMFGLMIILEVNGGTAFMHQKSINKNSGAWGEGILVWNGRLVRYYSV